MSGQEDPERYLALSYAVPAAQPGLTALLALDGTLGQILRTTREPMVGQMRLTWWHEALSALDHTAPPAQPVLQALATEVVSRGVSGAALAGMIDGWEVLLDPDPLTRTTLEAYAAHRGGTLFAQAGVLLGAGPRDPLLQAGAGWALADLARHVRDAEAAALPRMLSQHELDAAFGLRWSRPARALGALALTARMDLAMLQDGGPPSTSPRRVARLAWHRISGR
ncbi:squalene/phytoene synthase family protein [Sphingomonas sp. PAMC 26621]|uniref:squalene/phytoene synthase family protein n=1 Tax=Sphingomonas sp. PAMC 26621 TaxID=1112213 RepID=UPI0002890FBC|nr:squalene/phytoene synthase family protein [Sphingomonas sp. PAMC 26621]